MIFKGVGGCIKIICIYVEIIPFKKIESHPAEFMQILL